MKIKCDCGNIIVDQTDYLKNKGHLISDSQWFDFWDSIDEAVEQTGSTAKEKEETTMQLRMQKPFKVCWECQKCGKLFIEGRKNNLITYSPDNKKYNSVLDKK